MKTRQSKRLHNQNVGTIKPVHLHNNEETTMSKYLYYAGYVILAALTLFFCWMFCLRWGVFGAKLTALPNPFRFSHRYNKSTEAIKHSISITITYVDIFTKGNA